jgi:DNA primase
VIPPSFIHDLLARADVAEIVGRTVQLKKAGANYKGLCPFHGEKSPSFVVSPTRQTYHCFGCGVHGNAIGFLMEYSGLGFVDAVKELASTLGVAVPDDDVSPAERAQAEKAREQRATLTDVLKKAAQHYRGQLRENAVPIAYLKKRGLSGEIAKRFGLGYAPPGWNGLASVFAQYDDPLLVQAGLVIEKEDEGEHAGNNGGSSGSGSNSGLRRRWDRFRDRVMFPIRDVKGEVIGFGARVMDGGGEPKYLNSPETPVFVKGRELYGLFEARQVIRERGHVLVTEGYMDVVALAQLGFGNAVATLGTACTADHVAKLLRFSEHIVFSFDGDGAGRRAAARAMEAVLTHATDTRSFRFLFLPPEHDPDSYVREHGPEAFEALISQAVPLSQQLVAQAGEACDLGTAEGRSRMLATARPWLDQLPPGLLREQILSELADQGGVSADTLRAHWSTGSPSLAQRQRVGGAGPASRPGELSETSALAADWRTHDDGSPPGYHDREGAERLNPGWKQRGSGSPSNAGRFKSRRFGDGPYAPFAAARRTPLRTATLLDRAAWLLLHKAESWLQFPAEVHENLCASPTPYGEFFAGLERVLHDQGSLPAHGLAEELRRDAAAHDPSVIALIQRLSDLHEVSDTTQADSELAAILQRLKLQAIEDEIALLLESGELSDAAAQRGKQLMAQRAQLKSRP